ncbi:MAG: 1,4-alpha-glucan branching protein GlgB [Caldicoprobacterales bacterium]
MSNFLKQEEIFLFNEGTFYNCYLKFGAHRIRLNDTWGVHFALWAPNASQVRIVGDFNSWEGHRHIMEYRKGEVWELFIPNLDVGEIYKYEIITSKGDNVLKADPFAFYSELRPNTASIVYSLDGYQWGDSQWMAKREELSAKDCPLNIYEVHLGSWKRKDDNSLYSYRELADLLIPYVKDMGFTHIEILPLMEHPFDGSWGYQLTGYYSATSRYGTPHDLMYFIDCCHREGLGVILDWVPGHFCRDAHGLGVFDGFPLFEGGDHQEWGTYEFDFSRTEVWSFLIGSAVFWLDKFHVDGLRVDGVTSMLYLDYGKGDSPWKPNIHGGRENLEAIEFLQTLNDIVHKLYPGALMIAEESTDWPSVTKPPEDGGLGFDYKWNMGWMNDTLDYMKTDFSHRRDQHNKLTFSLLYAFSENFILPFSHDEVVHGKKSLIGRMPGDYWRQFAGLRALRVYQMCHPGKKLLFMGSEFGQFIEWRYYEELEWFLLEYDTHRGYKNFVRDLNILYLKEPSLWENDTDWDGFQWIDVNNADQSVIVFLRKSRDGDFILTILNFKPDFYPEYRVGVPEQGLYEEIFNSDSKCYGGSGQVNNGLIEAETIPYHGQAYSIHIKVPPLGGVLIKLSKKYVVMEAEHVKEQGKLYKGLQDEVCRNSGKES